MSSIGTIAAQNPILSSNRNPPQQAAQQVSSKDGDGDHGIEPAVQAAQASAPAAATPASGQPGAIINTTA